MSRVRLIATGGTIASRRSEGGLRAGATGKELLAAAQLDDGLEVEDVHTKGSFALGLPDLMELVRSVRNALDDGVDGVVLTHGTDTMEETAFLLDLLHDDPRPVVLTGAQRAFDHPAPDGPENLRAAVAVARSEQARDLGVLLAFDGVAFRAPGVRKVETLRSAAFAAPGRGPALRVTPDGVLLLARAPRPRPFALDGSADLPRVDVVPLYAGADATLLDAAVAAGAAGVVLEAFGAGNATPVVTEAVAPLVERGIPVLVTSRVGSGPVAALYTGGGGADLERDGAIFAADLSPWQARLLLTVALAAAPDDPRSAVTEWLRGWTT